MYIEAIDWSNRLSKDKLIWTYPGHGPHAVFSLNDQHSDFYFNSDILKEQNTLLDEICDVLSAKIKMHSPVLPDFVLTYPPYGVQLGQGIAKTLGCQFNALKSLEATTFEIALFKNARVLLCADDIIGGTSINNLLRAALQSGAHVMKAIIVVANLSGKNTFGDLEIISLIDRKTNTWAPENCKLCSLGSLALNARANWKTLTDSE